MQSCVVSSLNPASETQKVWNVYVLTGVGKCRVEPYHCDQAPENRRQAQTKQAALGDSME